VSSKKTGADNTWFISLIHYNKGIRTYVRIVSI